VEPKNPRPPPPLPAAAYAEPDAALAKLIGGVDAATRAKDWPGAVASAERALEEARRQGKESTAVAAEIFDSLGNATWKLREYRRAAKAYQQSLRIKELVFGRDSVEVANASSLLGRVELDDCQVERARVDLERAATFRTPSPTSEKTLWQSALALSNVFRSMRDEARADSYLLRAVPFLEAHEPEAHADLMSSFLALAHLHRRVSNRAEEVRAFERAFAIAKLPEDAEWVLLAAERLPSVVDETTMARYLERFHVVTWTGGDVNYAIEEPTVPRPFEHCSESPRRAGQVSDAEKTVSALKAPFRACYNAELATRPALDGTLRHRAGIGVDGTIRRVDGRGLGVPPSLVECVGKAILGAHFAPPQGGKATIEIPIVFKVAPN
jgi:tetratricopeptide (TPR) repeat protein